MNKLEEIEYIYNLENLKYHVQVPTDVVIYLNANPTHEVRIKGVVGEHPDHDFNWHVVPRFQGQITCNCGCITIIEK